MQKIRWNRFILPATLLFGFGFFCGAYWENAKAPFHAPLRTESRQQPAALSSAAAPAPPSEQTASGTRPTLSGAAPDATKKKFSNADKNATVPPFQKPDVAAKSAPPKRELAAVKDALPFALSHSGFTLHKLGAGEGPTLMIVGGIQGDEPGGFSAAALIASHYTITQGSVWVVPDLNFPSILQRNRGVFGDLNRKFASLEPNDPEYATIAAIKSILLDKQVNLILNLHDGSGFYRPTWEDPLHNPKRWGQSVIIDQEEVDAVRFNKLHEIASHVEREINGALLEPGHRYHIHNTHTAAGNKEMAKTLSYFAVCNGKPAFGIEASKEFTTEYRSYYHLLAIEAFMRHMGIVFERNFELSPPGVRAALNSDLMLAAYDNRLILHLDNPRASLNMVPFKKDAPSDIKASKPLLALVPEHDGKTWRVAYGNRTLTRVHPEFVDFDESLQELTMLIDGELRTIPLGDIVPVKESFLVQADADYRVNAIGAQKEINGTEAGVRLTKADFMPRFSIDKGETTYRVEVYKGKAFAGMVLVRFDGGSLPAQEPLTATTGSESSLGF